MAKSFPTMVLYNSYEYRISDTLDFYFLDYFIIDLCNIFNEKETFRIISSRWAFYFLFCLFCDKLGIRSLGFQKCYLPIWRGGYIYCILGIIKSHINSLSWSKAKKIMRVCTLNIMSPLIMIGILLHAISKVFITSRPK